MDHNLTIILILTVGFALACLFGVVAQGLKLPSILGYLVAGFIIGPNSPGFVADASIAEQLAEIGIILMLFSVGMHFQLQDLIDVKNIAIPGAIIQTLIVTATTTFFVYMSGWSIGSGIIIGLSIGVASTVVLVKVLHDNRLLNTLEGHIATGWTIVEDMLTVLILMLLPSLAAILNGNTPSFIGISLVILLSIGKFLLLILLMFTLGYKAVDFVLTNVARMKSQELFTLAVLALIFVIATSSALFFGTSLALGAFIAGMIIGKTSVRHQAAANSLPLKDTFAILFFLSVGMLFSPMAIVNHFAIFSAVLAVILLLKPFSAYLITALFGYPLKAALTVGVSLAQIGEFSFILAEEAMNRKLLPDDGFDILVACALISISINPILFKLLPKIEDLFKKLNLDHSYVLINLKPKEKNTKKQVVIIGCGIIGRHVGDIAEKQGLEPLFIENNIDRITLLKEDYEVIFGNACEMDILVKANIQEAAFLIITISDTEKTFTIIEQAKEVNPQLRIIARVEHSEEKLILNQSHIHSISTENELVKAFNNLSLHLFKKNYILKS